jgi:hypothetical protein
MDNQGEIFAVYVSNRTSRIRNHVDLDESVEIMLTRFSNVLDREGLDVIEIYATTHEQFSLITMEPYMLFILGQAMFFNLIIPLYREGAFSFFMREIITMSREKLAEIQYHVNLYSTRLLRMSREFVNYAVDHKCTSGVVLGLFSVM